MHSPDKSGAAGERQHVAWLGRTTARGTGVLAGAMLVVRLCGLVREMVVARRFGLADELAAYLLGLVLVALVNSLLGEALRECFVAAYLRRRREGGGHDPSRSDLFWPVLAQGLAAALAVAALLWAAYPTLLPLLGRQLKPATVELAVRLARLCAWLIPIQFAVAMGDALLHAARRFAPSGIAPAAIPLGIVAALTLWPEGGVQSMVAGFYGGAAVRLAVVFWAARDLVPPLRRAGGGTREVWSAWRFQAGLAAVASVNMAVDRFMGAFLGEQPLVALGYAMTLTHIFERFWIVTVVTALLPPLAAMWGDGRRDAARSGLGTSLQVMLLLVAPLSVLACFLSSDAVALLYQRGDFTFEATRQTAPVVAMYALGWPTIAVLSVAARGCIVADRMGIMGWIAGYELVSNTLLNLLLMRWLGAPGIALATSILYAGSAWIICSYLTRTAGFPLLGAVREAARVAVPALAVEAAGLLALARLFPRAGAAGPGALLARLALLGAAGLLLYGLAVWLIGRGLIRPWWRGLRGARQPAP